MKVRLESSLVRPPLGLPLLGLMSVLASTSCTIADANAPQAGGGAGATSTAGASSAGGSAGTAGSGGTAGSAAGMGGAPVAAAGTGGSAAGVGGSLGGVGGASAGAGGGAGMTNAGSGGSVNNVPADYKGTPFAVLKIPGRINACDYDRGGAGVAWCHDPGNCPAGTVTGDYPKASGVYRPPMPVDAPMCSGAACDDNVGVCRMNTAKPDNTITGQPMPATDTYLCYSTAGQWTKYTVVVEQAGTYAIGGVMAVPPSGGGANLSFGNDITSGNLSFAVTPNTNSGSGENYHSWDERSNLGSVTFPAAGTYVMTFTQVSRFNADAFTFTKQ